MKQLTITKYGLTSAQADAIVSKFVTVAGKLECVKSEDPDLPGTFKIDLLLDVGVFPGAGRVVTNVNWDTTATLVIQEG